ncbi:PREDICTED: uncharacterized protein LOC106815808 [Priapulus caudatus]|uniref:Uncharacterized protein LOC106815808 n=1 Tax=Priapulus caudatus TaxID=37621 RepID=A0ABM1EUD3_PRICU|nr:PREDICTED: uncharacterized protein LOC106815808 [Priapulus caudatus]
MWTELLEAIAGAIERSRPRVDIATATTPRDLSRVADSCGDLIDDLSAGTARRRPGDELSRRLPRGSAVRGRCLPSFAISRGALSRFLSAATAAAAREGEGPGGEPGSLPPGSIPAGLTRIVDSLSSVDDEIFPDESRRRDVAGCRGDGASSLGGGGGDGFSSDETATLDDALWRIEEGLEGYEECIEKLVGGATYLEDARCVAALRGVCGGLTTREVSLLLDTVASSAGLRQDTNVRQLLLATYDALPLYGKHRLLGRRLRACDVAMATGEWLCTVDFQQTLTAFLNKLSGGGDRLVGEVLRSPGAQRRGYGVAQGHRRSPAQQVACLLWAGVPRADARRAAATLRARCWRVLAWGSGETRRWRPPSRRCARRGGAGRAARGATAARRDGVAGSAECFSWRRGGGESLAY